MILLKKRFLVLVFLFLGLFVFSIIFIALKNITLFQSPAQKSSQEQLQNLVPSLYPGLSWTPRDKRLESQSSDYRLYYSSQKINGDVPLLGEEWVATKQNISEKELLKLESDFRNYYDREIRKFGWNLDIKTNGFLLQTTNAGGPRGDIWGYVKVDKGVVWVFILQTTRISAAGVPPPSLGCPCNMEFRAFVSGALSLSDILPNSL